MILPDFNVPYNWRYRTSCVSKHPRQDRGQRSQGQICNQKNASTREKPGPTWKGTWLTPLWDFQPVETDLYSALDMDSRKSAMGDSEEEALEQLKAIAPDAVNVR